AGGTGAGTGGGAAGPDRAGRVRDRAADRSRRSAADPSGRDRHAPYRLCHRGRAGCPVRRHLRPDQRLCRRRADPRRQSRRASLILDSLIALLPPQIGATVALVLLAASFGGSFITVAFGIGGGAFLLAIMA